MARNQPHLSLTTSTHPYLTLFALNPLSGLTHLRCRFLQGFPLNVVLSLANPTLVCRFQVLETVVSLNGRVALLSLLKLSAPGTPPHLLGF